VRLADERTLVVKRYVWPRFRAEEPAAAGRELDALLHANRCGLPVPAVVAADPSGDEVGDAIPGLLMTRLSGRAVASPDVDVLADAAATIHAAVADGFHHRYFPWCRETSTAPPRGCRRPSDWAHALDVWRSAEPPYEPRLIHRDFHPGNVLWSRGRLGGVVDWANACVGPVGMDVATCWGNLYDWAGPDVAGAFIRAYERASDRPHHPYWDVAKILEDDWDLVDDPRQVQFAEELLADALSRLTSWGRHVGER
jgi:Ser/Thr protein kinase RdoA (MazF antagonist)